MLLWIRIHRCDYFGDTDSIKFWSLKDWGLKLHLANTHRSKPSGENLFEQLASFPLVTSLSKLWCEYSIVSFPRPKNLFVVLFPKYQLQPFQWNALTGFGFCSLTSWKIHGKVFSYFFFFCLSFFTYVMDINGTFFMILWGLIGWM